MQPFRAICTTWKWTKAHFRIGWQLNYRLPSYRIASRCWRGFGARGFLTTAEPV